MIIFGIIFLIIFSGFIVWRLIAVFNLVIFPSKEEKENCFNCCFMNRIERDDMEPLNCKIYGKCKVPRTCGNFKDRKFYIAIKDENSDVWHTFSK